MSFVPDTLRNEYRILKTLRHMAELETESIPVMAMHELCNALDHIMRASEDDEDSQIQKAREHFIRAGRDLYFLLLTSKLDKLQALSSNLESGDLERFREEHLRIKNIVQTAQAKPEKIHSLSEYVKSLEEIDAFLSNFTELETQIATKHKLQREKYKHMLIAILSALFGALVSLIVGLLIK